MTRNLGNKVNGSILLLLNSEKVTPTFVWWSYRAAVEVTAVPAQLWERGQLMKLKGAATTFELWPLSCSLARHKSWHNCCQDFVPAGNGGRYQEELEEERAGAGSANHSNAACKICSVWQGIFPHLQTSTSNPNTLIASFPWQTYHKLPLLHVFLESSIRTS